MHKLLYLFLNIWLAYATNSEQSKDEKTENEGASTSFIITAGTTLAAFFLIYTYSRLVRRIKCDMNRVRELIDIYLLFNLI
jgi:hypothetical protein